MKKILTILLALALCFTLFAACGPKDTPQPDGADPADPTVIKIGFIGPLTGETAMYGEAVRNGAELRIAEINANGGINGNKVELIALDSKGDPTEATNAYTRLVDQDGVVGIIGPVLTGETLAVAELAADDEFPLITASATGDTITDIGTTLFRTCFKDSFQGGKMGEYAADKLGYKKVAVLYNNGSDYSVGLANAFVAACEAKGIEIVANESYAKDDTDFKSQLTNIAGTACEAIYVPDYYEKVSLVAQQAKDTGIDAPLLGGDGYPTLSDITDAAIVEGFYYTSHYDIGAATGSAQDFADAYKTLTGSDPISFAFLSYDAMQIYEAALTSAASTDKADIVAALKATDMDCLTSHYKFDADNNPIKDCMVMTIKDGADVFVEMY